MDERRAHKHRFDVGSDIEIVFGDEAVTARVLNVSFGGALLHAETRPPVDTNIEIRSDSPPSLEGVVVRHTDEGFAIDFGETLDAAQFALNSITSEMQVNDTAASEASAEELTDDTDDGSN